MTYVVTVKSTVKISQNFVAFSEYMNFKSTLCKKCHVGLLLKIIQSQEKCQITMLFAHINVPNKFITKTLSDCLSNCILHVGSKKNSFLEQFVVQDKEVLSSQDLLVQDQLNIKSCIYLDHSKYIFHFSENCTSCLLFLRNMILKRDFSQIYILLFQNHLNSIRKNK